MRIIKITLSLLLLALIAACAPKTIMPKNLYVSNDDEDGLGGTGRTVAPKLIANTYISGRITGFGSIWVNGVRVEFNRNAHFSVDQTRVSRYSMSVGEVVEVKALHKNKNYQAVSINVRHEIIGKVTHVNAKSKTARILKHTVSFKGTDIMLPHAGQWVEISGFTHPNGTIHATHARLAANKISLVRGKVRKTRRGVYVGKLRLTATSGLKLKHGELAVIKGRYQKGTLKVASQRPVVDAGKDKHIRKYIVQGFVYKQKRGVSVIDNVTIKNGGSKIRIKRGQKTTIELDVSRKNNGSKGRKEKSSPENDSGRSPGNSRGNSANANRVNANGNGVDNGNGSGNRTIQLAPGLGLTPSADNTPASTNRPSQPPGLVNQPSDGKAPIEKPERDKDDDKSPDRGQNREQGNAPERENERDNGNSPERETERESGSSPERETDRDNTPAPERESERPAPAAPEREAPEPARPSEVEREQRDRGQRDRERDNDRERENERAPIEREFSRDRDRDKDNDK